MTPIWLAWASARSGRRRRPLRTRHGLAECHAQGLMVAISESLCRVSLAEGLAEAGEIDDGLEVVDQAIAKSERSGKRWYAPKSSRSRRDFVEARCGEYGARRGSVPHRHRHRATAEGAELRAARGAIAGEAVSVDRPCRRRACRARARARRLLRRRRRCRRSARRRRCSLRSPKPPR